VLRHRFDAIVMPRLLVSSGRVGNHLRCERDLCPNGQSVRCQTHQRLLPVRV